MIRRYARFVAFLLSFAIVALATFLRFNGPQFGAAPALLIGFDAGAIVFFASLVSLFGDSTTESMRQRAQANEPDHHILLLLAAIVAIGVVAAVWVEFVEIKRLEDPFKTMMIALVTFSLILIWLFANALGTIHYAHLWYLRSAGGKDARGLDFLGPDKKPDLAPDFWDFSYFAAVLSMTFQVSDVEITTKSLRRLALVHSLVAFLFNISIIALTVSLVSSELAR